MNNEVKRFKVVNVLLVTFVLMLIVSVGLMLSQKWFIYTVNHTTSLSGKVYVIKKGEPVQKGDLVGFYGKARSNILKTLFL
ncbi:hypothetical protein [Acinetobacter baumannii]|uniref:hypothetical protein n=1 Tax=Acinetobacter baumannii TaxID=470 RepID=UPI000B2EB54B|nr:hypothetical protein [Acinetobacter baumannii]